MIGWLPLAWLLPAGSTVLASWLYGLLRSVQLATLVEAAVQRQHLPIKQHESHPCCTALSATNPWS